MSTTPTLDALDQLPYPDEEPAIDLNDEEWLTADEAAAWLRTHRQTIYKAVEAGQLPAVRLGTVVRIHRRKVLAMAGVKSEEGEA